MKLARVQVYYTEPPFWRPQCMGKPTFNLKKMYFLCTMKNIFTLKYAKYTVDGVQKTLFEKTLSGIFDII